MATSYNLTTYYAKRIIGDAAAATKNTIYLAAGEALIQTGADITANIWLLSHTKRLLNSPSELYGIRYAYDGSNGNDKIEFYGNYVASSVDTPTFWIQLNTGDFYAYGNANIDKTLTVGGTSLFKDNITIQTSSAPTITLESTASNAVDWDIKNNSGIFTIVNTGTAATYLYGENGTYNKGWEVYPCLYINTNIATGQSDPRYNFYVNGTSYLKGDTKTNAIFPDADNSYAIGGDSTRYTSYWASTAYYVSAGTSYSGEADVDTAGSALMPGHLEMTGNTDAYIDFKSTALNRTQTDYNVRIANEVSGCISIYGASTTADDVTTSATTNNTTYCNYTSSLSLYVTNGGIGTDNTIWAGGEIAQLATATGTTISGNNGFKLYVNGQQYGRLYAETVGTADVNQGDGQNGSAALILGNSTASGTANNAYGIIYLYGTGSKYTAIISDVNVYDRIWTIPKTGQDVYFVGTDKHTYTQYAMIYAGDTTYVTDATNVFNIPGPDAELGTQPGKVNGLFITGNCYGNNVDNLGSNVVNVFRYGDPGPQIRFSTTLGTDLAGGSKSGAIIYTTDDTNMNTDSAFHFVSRKDADLSTAFAAGITGVVTDAFVAKTSVTVGKNYRDTNNTLHVEGDSYLKGDVQTRAIFPDADNSYSVGNDSARYQQYWASDGFYVGAVVNTNDKYDGEANVNVAGSALMAGALEMTGDSNAYIDFKSKNANRNTWTDFNARIINDAPGRISIYGYKDTTNSTYAAASNTSYRGTTHTTALYVTNGGMGTNWDIWAGGEIAQMATHENENAATISGNSGFRLYVDNQQYGRLYSETVGTTTQNGSAALTLGNGISSGTDKNARGIIYLYSTGGYRAEIISGVNTANRTWTIPVTAGGRYFVGTTLSSFTKYKLLYAGDTTYAYETANVAYIPEQNAELGTTKGKVNGLFITGTCYGNTAANLGSNTVNVFRYGDPGPQIRFSTGLGTSLAGASESGAIIYSDHSSSIGLGSAFHFVAQSDANHTEANVGVVSKSFIAKSNLTVGANYLNTDATLYVTGTLQTSSTITSGGAITSGGTILASANISIKSSTINLKSATNAVTSTTYLPFYGRDKNDYVFAVFEGGAESDGDVLAWWGVQNRKTDGTAVGWRGMSITQSKADVITWSVSGADKFRSAISAPSTTGTNASGTWGISITGSCSGSSSSVSYTNTSLDVTKVKNNLSEAWDRNIAWIGDKSSSGVARINVYTYADTDKKVGIRLQARNYNSSTSTWGSYGGISVWAEKDGTFTYGVSNAANFRSAIGAGTSSLTIGTTSSTAAAGNHTHSYLPLSGGTMTGTIHFKDDVIVKGTAPSADNDTPGVYFNDKNGTTATTNRLGVVYNVVTSANVVQTRILAYKANTSNLTYGYFAAGYDTSNAVARTYTNCKVYGAVWNDYAEYRRGTITEGGYCVTETSEGILMKSTERLQPGCRITSDTFGFAIGETKECQTPIAVSGRVLVYTYRSREEYPLGAALCSAPNGTVDIMTREEIREYPERIVGVVSEIPNYEVWHCGGDGKEDDDVAVPVNNRIWIYVR